MSNKYEDLIKNARVNAECGEHMSPEEITTLLNVVETTFAALAAESAGLKNALEWLYETVSSESVSIPDEKYSSVTNAAQVLSETPATEAVLDEVRAQGVEAFLRDSQLPYQIATVLADYDYVDDATLQTVIWSGQPPEPDGDVWHAEGNSVYGGRYDVGDSICYDHIASCESVNGESPLADFIAAANPATVLAPLDELEAKDNRINRLEAIVAVAEQRNALMREWKRALKVPCDLVDDQVPVVIHGMVIRLDRLKETEAKLEAAEKRIAELEASHRNLREAMAGIHNTITGGGAHTPLAAILNASKRAYEESAAAAGKGEAS